MSNDKPRLVQVVEPEWSLLRMAQGDLGAPHIVLDRATSWGWADADELRAWRSQNTSASKEPT